MNVDVYNDFGMGLFLFLYNLVFFTAQCRTQIFILTFLPTNRTVVCLCTRHIIINSWSRDGTRHVFVQFL